MYDAEFVCAYTGRLEQATRQQNESATALEAQKSAFQQLNSSQSSLQRRVDLISKERDSLKQLIGLYQDESGTRAASGGAGLTKHCSKHALHLDKLLNYSFLNQLQLIKYVTASGTVLQSQTHHLLPLTPWVLCLCTHILHWPLQQCGLFQSQQQPPNQTCLQMQMERHKELRK